jgi:hypothetical protein
VWCDAINDEVMHSFADALANNNKLRELNVGDITDVDDIAYNNITLDGYAAMTNILCNTSSILNTFNSNHTLVALCYEYDESLLPLKSLLQINRENSVCASARLKIINTHFSGSEINILPFVVMNLSV